MARVARRSGLELFYQAARARWAGPTLARFRGGLTAACGMALVAAFASYHATDPSLNAAAAGRAKNLLGGVGADVADVALQSLGLGAWLAALIMIAAGLSRAGEQDPALGRQQLRRRALIGMLGVFALTGLLAAPPAPETWPLARGLGGFWGEAMLKSLAGLIHFVRLPAASLIAAVVLGAGGLAALVYAIGLGVADILALGPLIAARLHKPPSPPAAAEETPVRRRRTAPVMTMEPPEAAETVETDATGDNQLITAPKVKTPRHQVRDSDREQRENQKAFDFAKPAGFHLPELAMLAKPKPRASAFDEEALRQNARMLEGVLAEFGVKGQIDQIRPGPVVTLYELAPAPGVKSARVVALSDDIARSMSVAACRVSVVQGRNAIGIELPNARRETVYLRDLLSSTEYDKTSHVLPLALGESIDGQPYITDLARMPHLLIAGTTGSGKSVVVNAMILSILYRLAPHQCRFIMIDPKMLELSVYDGIPHLLAPVVTDPKKAIVALKWTVREMEDRYRRMSKIGVRNVAGYNEKAVEAQAKGEHFVRTVQTGFDEQGRPIYEEEQLRPEPMPYLVVVIDEVADLMMVAGKDIEGAVQRLAQMARAAGIHLIMATQRPSVDVITGTIKANFPTRISFQVTSKIDSRTIMGEQGAEQLLGQGDMLYMAGGGRITRLHGPFVSDGEVETVARYLRDQGEPQYLEEVTAGGDEDGGDDGDPMGENGSGDDLYDRAVAVVTRDRKASTSYIQRRLQIGYNRAASLIERMEQEGVVSQANHAGKRDILAGPPPS
ncbi:MAG TPA: DNA translocase FtsK 4TM domain-containing protein [Caulobacteraceae bacterium]|nr:DNA translocase FtsK 4TM domain-containing protein [Caulobacteraceae bacterium]